MLEGGEDPRFIVRRMVVLASEDIGNADPQALVVATAAAAAVEHVGLPECQFALAQAAIYLSLAPKSDAAKRAVFAARELHPRARRRGRRPRTCAPRPAATAATTTRTARPGHLSPQELLPDAAVGARFYEPDDAEAALRERSSIRSGDARGVARPRQPSRLLSAVEAATATGSARVVQPATGERIGAVPITAPEEVAGRRRRRRQGPAVLGAADARAGRARYLERAAQVLIDEARRDPRPDRPRAGQAAQRGVLDGGPADDRRAHAGSRTPGRRSSPTRRSRCRSCSSRPRARRSPTSRSA